MRRVVSILERGGALRGAVAVRLAIVVALAAASGATAGALPSIIGVAVNALVARNAPIGPGFLGVFARAVAGLGAGWVVLAAAVATFAVVGLAVVASRESSRLAGDVTASLRVELVKAVLHASPRDVDAIGKNALQGPPRPGPPGAVTPVARGMETVKLAVAQRSAMVAEFVLAIASGLPQATLTLLVLAWELWMSGALVLLLGALALFAISRLLSDRASKRVAREMSRMQDTDAALFSTLGETLAATEDLRLLGARREALLELEVAAHACADAKKRFAGALAVSGQIKSVFAALAPLLLLVALLSSGRAIDPGGIARLLLVLPLLMARLEAIDALRTGLIERGPLLDATLALLALPPSPRAASNPIPVSAVERTSIEFDDVRYRPEGAKANILDGVTLNIPEGSLIGVVGPSGSGKTTLLRLLLRLDDPQSGKISIGDTTLSDIAPDDLPLLFGVVSQATRILERSVAKNLTLGLDGKNKPSELRDALTAVELGALDLESSFVAVPPSLSGGEQRRLLLARLLLRACRVLVIDEPEAGLPSATAEQILARVAAVAKGRTTIVVTHAPHLLKSDFNVLMDCGKVVAKGTHAELCATSELYRSLLAESLKARPEHETAL